MPEIALTNSSYFKLMLNNLIKKGKKEKIFKILLRVLKTLKFKTKKDPLFIFEKMLFKNEKKIQLVITNLEEIQKLEKKKKKTKDKKLKKKNIKIRGFISYVKNYRLKRKSVKDFLKNLNNSNKTLITNLETKLFTELLLCCFNKGNVYKKKKEFYRYLKKLRPSLKLVQKKTMSKKKRVKLY